MKHMCPCLCVPVWRIVQSISSFESLSLHENILRGISDYGLEKPSGVQQHWSVNNQCCRSCAP
jgi:hypothetical protein